MYDLWVRLTDYKKIIAKANVRDTEGSRYIDIIETRQERKEIKVFRNKTHGTWQWIMEP